MSRPRRELRSARRLVVRPGPAPAHGHRSQAHGSSGTLHTCGAWSLCVPVGGDPPVSRPRRELRSARRLEARPCPRSLRRPPHQWCLVAVCARGWRPACEPSALRASLGASPRCPARPPAQRHRGVTRCPQVSCPALACRIAEPTLNFARNSPATISNSELRSLELQRFQTLLRLHPIELRAIFVGGAAVTDECCGQVLGLPADRYRGLVPPL